MSNLLVTRSGSDWDQYELNFFNVAKPTEVRWLSCLKDHGLKENVARVGDATAELLKSVIGEVIGNEYNAYNGRTHRSLLSEGGSVQLGPFFTHLATVAQIWRLDNAGTETTSLVGRPGRKVQPPKSFAGVLRDTLYDRYTNTFTPENRTQSMEAHGATPRDIAAEREKAETVTNSMISLFLEAVLEFSKLRDRMENEPEASTEAFPKERMEWHHIPTQFTIATPQCQCTSINDGSLFKKEIVTVNRRHQWKNASNIVYGSIETKAMYKAYTKEGKHPQAVKVRAQEASQMIGMICQRIAEFKLDRGTAFNIQDLDEHDRTVFLISCTQTGILIKAAVFSHAYLKHHRLGESPPEIPREQKDPITPTKTKSTGLEKSMSDLRIPSGGFGTSVRFHNTRSKDEGQGKLKGGPVPAKPPFRVGGRSQAKSQAESSQPGGVKGKGTVKIQDDPVVAERTVGVRGRGQVKGQDEPVAAQRPVELKDEGQGKLKKRPVPARPPLAVSGRGQAKSQDESVQPVDVKGKGREKSQDDPVPAERPIGVEGEGNEQNPAVAVVPKLKIEQAGYFSLRNGLEAIAAANLCIAIVEYLENRGAVLSKDS